MEILADDLVVQVPIEIPLPNREEGTYRDTLFLTVAELRKLDDDALHALKQARFDAFIEMRNAPPPEPVAVTIEDARAQARDALVAAADALAQAQDALDRVPEADTLDGV